MCNPQKCVKCGVWVAADAMKIHISNFHWKAVKESVLQNQLIQKEFNGNSISLKDESCRIINYEINDSNNGK